MASETRALASPPGAMGREIAGKLGTITLEKVTEIGFAHAALHAKRIAAGKTILELRDTSLMAAESALVIAAGPSIHRYDTAGMIRRSGYQGTIIATESAAYWCLRNGIVPDLLLSLDPHAERVVRCLGDPGLTDAAVARDDYFARQDMDPKFHDDQIRANNEILQLVNEFGPRMKMAVASCASEPLVARAEQAGIDLYWWNPMYDDYDAPDSLTRRIHDMNGLPCVNAGGNAGSACWVIAHAVLQKKRVGLVGMDFGYYPDTSYVQTQYYKEILSMVGPDRLDEMYVRITNPDLGREFYTDPAYLWYRDAFVEMAADAACETVNCTGGGILFGPAIRTMDLESFLAGRA